MSDTSKIAPKKKTEPTFTGTAVCIERRSHLGYVASQLTIEDGKIVNKKELHSTPDLESVAVALATDALEDNMR